MSYYFYNDKDEYTEDSLRAEDYLEKDMDIREIYEISRTTMRLEDIAL